MNFTHPVNEPTEFSSAETRRIARIKVRSAELGKPEVKESLFSFFRGSTICADLPEYLRIRTLGLRFLRSSYLHLTTP